MRRDILDNKFCVVWGYYPEESLSDVEVCMGILAYDKDTFLNWCELYRGFVLGDNPNNPIDTVSKRIDVYN